MGEPIPLLLGAYTARSLIANAQRSVNLYSEFNTKDQESPVTHYVTPGLARLSAGPQVAPFRCLYMATNNQLLGCVGNGIYAISPAWAFALIGTINTTSGQVSMQDNAIDLVIVDGSPIGYQVPLATLAGFSQIVDANFLGGNRVDYLDTFLLFAQPNSRVIRGTLSNTVTPFDPLYFAEKVGYADPLSTLIVLHREVWLFGTQRATEIWYLQGADSGFPFARMPGAYIEQGCVAKNSVAKDDLRVFWLGQNANGNASVYMGKGYACESVSTFALEWEIQNYSNVSDAIGMCYNQAGHNFYMLTFPSQDKTWCYDADTNEWHERSWCDSNGVEHRHRANCITSAYGKIVCGDFENGNLYEMSLSEYTDYGGPIVRRRGWPHLLQGGNGVSYNYFTANMDCGNLTGTLITSPAEVSLRWSDTRGHTFGNAVLQSFGATGQYLVQPKWSQLGYARDRVFELFWSSPAFTAVQGAWIDVAGGKT